MREKLDPNKVNILNRNIEKFVLAATIEQKLSELTKTDEHYLKALSISKGDGYELHPTRPPNSCFVKSFFEDCLKGWQENMDIQPVFNKYNIIAYMFSNFSKSKDQSSAAIMQASQEAFEN